MQTVKVNFNKPTGKIKPMHAVNNGPLYKFNADQRITNIDAFMEAGIPYARNHDASFCSTYGGEHTVDVHAIFPNFNADPYDERSYDFPVTDEYMRVLDHAGVKAFYRLGSKIEHGVKKYGTIPPPDFKKWAIICEHVIRHYTEGWANGFHYDIEYWEIWNEADLDPDDSKNKRNWGGTAQQFYELFDIALSHLKSKFPHLKIGGPAMSSPKRDWFDGLVKNTRLKPDFFSWHRYSNDAEKIIAQTADVRLMLDEVGWTQTESILNEWNYVQDWSGDAWIYSLKSIKGIKGASFTSAVMCGCQYQPLDMLMYYDARPCAMNGLFNTDLCCEKLKGYYPFLMFGTLYKLGTAVQVERELNRGIFLSAAKDDTTSAVMLTHFCNDDTAQAQQVKVVLEGVAEGATAEIYLLDDTHDMQLIETRRATNEFVLDMPLFATVLMIIK